MNCYTQSFPCCPLSAHDSAYQIKEVLLFGQPYYKPGVSFDQHRRRKMRVKFNQLLHLNLVLPNFLFNYFVDSNVCKLLFVVTTVDKLLHSHDSQHFEALQAALPQMITGLAGKQTLIVIETHHVPFLHTNLSSCRHSIVSTGNYNCCLSRKKQLLNSYVSILYHLKSSVSVQSDQTVRKLVRKQKHFFPDHIKAVTIT